MGSYGRKAWVRLFSALLIAVLLVAVQGSVSAAENAGHMIKDGTRVPLLAGSVPSYTQIAPPADYQLRANAAPATIIVNYGPGFSAPAQAAFQHAVDIWASLVSSPVPIVVDATWEPDAPNILGSAGATTIHANFTGAPVMNAWYPVAIANALTGTDNVPGVADIGANFNSAFPLWYFGLDGNPGSGQYDFVTVVLHELCHGLGFFGSATVSGVTGILGFTDNSGTFTFPMVYDTAVENGSGTAITSFTSPSAALGAQLISDNLFYDSMNIRNANGGATMKIFAPGPGYSVQFNGWTQGSSYSHFDEKMYPAGDPRSLMTPSLAPNEAIHDPGDVVLALFRDLGWTAATPPDPIVVDVMGNGSDGPLVLNKGDNLTLNATITNASGQQGDYFLVAVYKGMFFTYKFASKAFVPGQSATFQGPLLNLTAKRIYSSSKLPKGKIIFYFAVDENQNNGVDTGSLAFDKLTVRVN